MLQFAIPGFGSLRIEHLVLDYNGTLAEDGKLLPGVRRRLQTVSSMLALHVLTADTFGFARNQVRGVTCKLTILPAKGQDTAKRSYVERLGRARVACIGNGRNDRLMLKAAALGIVVTQKEGAASAAIAAADLIVPDIIAALELFTKPLRLTATLRT